MLSWYNIWIFDPFSVHVCIPFEYYSSMYFKYVHKVRSCMPRFEWRINISSSSIHSIISMSLWWCVQLQFVHNFVLIKYVQLYWFTSSNMFSNDDDVNLFWYRNYIDNRFSFHISISENIHAEMSFISEKDLMRLCVCLICIQYCTNLQLLCFYSSLTCIVCTCTKYYQQFMISCYKIECSFIYIHCTSLSNSNTKNYTNIFMVWVDNCDLVYCYVLRHTFEIRIKQAKKNCSTFISVLFYPGIHTLIYFCITLLSFWWRHNVVCIKTATWSNRKKSRFPINDHYSFFILSFLPCLSLLCLHLNRFYLSSFLVYSNLFGITSIKISSLCLYFLGYFIFSCVTNAATGRNIFSINGLFLQIFES